MIKIAPSQKQTIKVCGANNRRQIPVDSNNKSKDGRCHVICPPIDLPYDLTTLLSLTIYSNHAIWVTNYGMAHATGDNYGSRLPGSIPKNQLKMATEITVKDQKEQVYNIVSTVCGTNYTLFLIQRPANTNKPNEVRPKYLAYTYYEKNQSQPLFPDLDGHEPVALYGGDNICAAIDSDGGVIIITPDIFDDPDGVPLTADLPDGERCACIACCNQFIIFLSTSGRIFGTFLDETNSWSKFVEVVELRGKKFVQISGTCQHCFAVTNTGRVYGIGSNEFGQLGLGNKAPKLVQKFTILDTIKQHKIKAAAAGVNHSLFLNEEGKVIACGKNDRGQLFIGDLSQDCYHYPVETTIKGGCVYIIAGGFISLACMYGRPPNCPNMPIDDEYQVTEALAAPWRPG